MLCLHGEIFVPSLGMYLKYYGKRWRKRGEGRKKRLKKKKGNGAKILLRYYPNSSLAMAKSKDPHRAYYTIGPVI